MKLTRSEVFTLVNQERAYQDLKWPKHAHESPIEMMTYVQHYINVAFENSSTLDWDKPENVEAFMENFRKIAGLAVSAMERHGCPPRFKN